MYFSSNSTLQIRSEFFELEYKIKEICRERLSQKIGKCSYIHEVLDVIQFQFL